MRVGCPKEIKNHEYRVGLTPGSVREYIAHGHDVIVETNAGAGIGAGDDAYKAAGAKVVGTANEGQGLLCTNLFSLFLIQCIDSHGGR